jgi:hypothetical protein
MNRLVLILMGVAVSGFMFWRSATRWPQPQEDRPITSAPAARQAAIDPTQAVIRFLGDLDDLLDTVHDSASFAAVKPKLLARAREQAALAAQHPNQGMSSLNPSATIQWQKAAKRHAESLASATKADPAVADFFAHDLAAILSSE